MEFIDLRYASDDAEEIKPERNRTLTPSKSLSQSTTQSISTDSISEALRRTDPKP